MSTSRASPARRPGRPRHGQVAAADAGPKLGANDAGSPGEHVGAAAVVARDHRHRRLAAASTQPGRRGQRQVGRHHQQRRPVGRGGRGRGQGAVQVAGPRRLLDHPAAHGVGPPPHLRSGETTTGWPAQGPPGGRRHVLEHGDGQQPPLQRPDLGREAALGLGQGFHGDERNRHRRQRYYAPSMAGRRYPVYTLAKVVVPPVIRFWVRLDCQGLLNIPAHGPVIIAANHISYFDPLCLGTFIHTAGRQVRFLAKSELYRNPALGAILRGAGQIPVYRETRDAHQALVDAVAAMRDGAGGHLPGGHHHPQPRLLADGGQERGRPAGRPHRGAGRAGGPVGRASALHPGQAGAVPARDPGGRAGRTADRPRPHPESGLPRSTRPRTR